jgi:hypothetical protein
MTEIFKGVFIAICGLLPAGALYVMLNAVDVDASMLAVQAQDSAEAVVDISQVEELPAEVIAAEWDQLLAFAVVDYEAPIEAIRVRDTLGEYSLSDAVNITGLTPLAITHAIVEHQPVEGYLFEYAREGMVMVLTPPDTSVFPNILEAEVITGIPRELIELSLTTHKTVDGTKFGYEK